jgi:hypothetical protein
MQYFSMGDQTKGCKLGHLSSYRCACEGVCVPATHYAFSWHLPPSRSLTCEDPPSTQIYWENRLIRSTLLCPEFIPVIGTSIITEPAIRGHEHIKRNAQVNRTVKGNGKCQQRKN